MKKEFDVEGGAALDDFADEEEKSSLSSSPPTLSRKVMPSSSSSFSGKDGGEKKLCCTASSLFSSIFTIKNWTRGYSAKRDLVRDAVAGLTVGVMAVPQSMSYASIAGLAPVFGLYNALFGILLYPLLGTSPHLITGPTAVMSIIVMGSVPRRWHGASVEPNMPGDSTWAELAFALAFVAGILQLVMGFLRVGFVVELISHPVIVGFTSAAAFLIAGTQMPSLLGIPKCDPRDLYPKDSVNDECYLHEVIYSIAIHLKDANVPTVVASMCAIALLLFFKLYLKKLKRVGFILGSLGPLVLVLITIPIISSLGTTLEKGKAYDAHFHIRIVGNITAGLPSPRSPFLAMHSVRDFFDLFSSAIAIALVGYMESFTISKTVARKKRVGNIKPSRELLALGGCNLICSCFQGYPVTGSFSRTAVNADAGAKSPLSAWFASTVIMFVLLFLTPVMKYMPKFVLSSIVIVSVVNLIEVHEVIFLYKVCRRDLFVFCVVFVFTLFTGVQAGLLVGILLNWMSSLMHRVKAEAVVLVRRERTEKRDLDKQTPKLVRNYSFADASCDEVRVRDIASRDHERVVCIKINGNVDFANADAIHQAIGEACESFSPDIVVLDFSRVHTIDGSGVRLLQTISGTLQKAGTYLRLAGLHSDALGTLQCARAHIKDLQSGSSRWDTFPRSAALVSQDASRGRSEARAESKERESEIGEAALVIYAHVHEAVTADLPEISHAEAGDAPRLSFGLRSRVKRSSFAPHKEPLLMTESQAMDIRSSVRSYDSATLATSPGIRALASSLTPSFVAFKQNPLVLQPWDGGKDATSRRSF